MRKVCLFFIFSFIHAQWSTESAYLIDNNRKELGLFTGMEYRENIESALFEVEPLFLYKQGIQRQ